MSKGELKESTRGTVGETPPFLDKVRFATLIIVAICAVGSTIFMIRAGTNTPRLLLIGFIFWILSPFAVLVWGILVSRKWHKGSRVALYTVAGMISIVSLAAYGEIIDIAPEGSANAFRFVITAPVAMFLISVTLVAGALISRLRSRSGKSG